jgi:predicted HTH domain antitoxin
MNLTISIPDEFAGLLGCSAKERERHAREAVAIEIYREGKISLRHMGELAGVGSDYWAANRLRISRQAAINYSFEDLEQDREAAGRLLL